MSWGGKRPGAGRPKGAISRSTLAMIEASRLGGEMPIEYMLRVMRDPNVWALRRDKMAVTVAAYLHARLPVLPADDGEAEGEASAPSPEGEATKET